MKVFKYENDIVVLNEVRQVELDVHSEAHAVLRFHFPEQIVSVHFNDVEKANTAYGIVYELLKED